MILAKKLLAFPEHNNIELVGVTVSSTFSTSSGQVVAIPEVTQEGDLVIVAIAASSAGNISPAVLSPEGYNQIGDLYADDSYDANLGVAYKLMGEVVDTSVTVTGCYGSSSWGAGAVVTVWRGVHQETPIEGSIRTAATTNSIVPTFPPITPITDGALIVTMGATASNTNGYVYQAPVGCETVATAKFFSTTGGNDSSMCIGTIPWTRDMNTVYLGPYTATGNSTSASAVACSISLKPA